MDGYNLTFPTSPHTGKERSRYKLSKRDTHSLGYGLAAEDVQAPFLNLEVRLTPNVPSRIRERLVVARDLATYGYFCYEFYAVSLFWSVSCIEMALRHKFAEYHRGPVLLRRTGNGREDVCEVPFSELRSRLRQRWRIPGMKWFDFSFRALLRWAFEARFLPEDIPIPLQELFHSARSYFKTLRKTIMKQAI